MTSVLTGDIIKSGNYQPDSWLKPLKEGLLTIGKEGETWEIYRGDSFQVEITDIKDSFLKAMYLKACIKTVKGLDVRMAIGIGNRSFTGKSITESNGEAFRNSGETLEVLKKEKTNLKLKTTKSSLDKELNLYFKLALIAMDDWTMNSAEMVKLYIENPKYRQEDIAKIIGISQDAVSKRIKRAHLEKLLELDAMYKQKLITLTQ